MFLIARSVDVGDADMVVPVTQKSSTKASPLASRSGCMLGHGDAIAASALSAEVLMSQPKKILFFFTYTGLSMCKFGHHYPHLIDSFMLAHDKTAFLPQHCKCH